MAWATLLLGGAQMLLGADQKDKANKEANKALAMRQPYKTPAEIYQILQATEYNAQNGFDPATLNYLTNQTDRAFSSALETTQSLGGDPNDVAGLFDQKMQSILKIGSENHAENIANFNRFLNAKQLVASGKDAEWQDAENKVKDLQQKAAQDKADATKQISEGLNTTVSGISQLGMDNLYSDNADLKGDFNDEFGTKKTGYDKKKGTGRQNYRWSKKLGITSLSEYNDFQDSLRKVKFR